jgi:hypothetical protein
MTTVIIRGGIRILSKHIHQLQNPDMVNISRNFGFAGSNLQLKNGMTGKKLKYVLEARVPVPSQKLTLCVRAEGSDRDLRSIGISALLQLLEVKWQQLNEGIHRLSIRPDKISARRRDASGRYITDMVLPAKVTKVTSHAEKIRLINAYNAILFRAAQVETRVLIR